MAQAYAYTVYRGTFIQTPRLPESTAKPKIELVRNRGALWVSSADGRIKGFDWQACDDASFRELMTRNAWVDVDAPETNGYGGNEVKVKIVHASEERNEFFFPGFIDTHIHAPQFPNVGLFGSSTLLDWLETYTFPVESGFGVQADQPNGDAKLPKDAPPSALRIYDQVVARTLSHGTTCASYFATIHVPATNVLAALCHSRGQRAFIGRVCMDNPDFCPPYYKDLSADDSLSATRSMIEYIHALDPKGTLVKPILTPRFAPTCTRPALEGLGKLAAEFNPPLHIQTHISENTNEVALVKELFPEAKNYADVYDRYNLLTKRTILAHAVHLTPDERNLVRRRDAKISHCPASNSALGSGVAPVRIFLDEGITVGLGTDVSGGYSPSILEAARQACLVSRLLGHTKSFCQPGIKHAHENGDADKPTLGREKLSVEESLYLATRGGAAVVDMADDLGGFDEGMIWDAQLIELGAVRELSENPFEVQTNGASSLVKTGPVGNVDLFGTETWEEKIHKWVWSGDDRNVKAVWVAGRLVHSRS
ncbi:guanine deaminase [Penicillium cataractarum]|uniref:Probable guanine deaminase n=1 Tax=Penicillium cataractarum TaxID=2100454 RepID=A0A9W9V7M2_9EURO|nr:guanine deaminase [Penicillium cataractarum]KAJ5369281.1 guanine deaminase [Penicillium cataractarum]